MKHYYTTMIITIVLFNLCLSFQGSEEASLSLRIANAMSITSLIVLSIGIIFFLLKKKILFGFMYGFIKLFSLKSQELIFLLDSKIKKRLFVYIKPLLLIGIILYVNSIFFIIFIV